MMAILFWDPTGIVSMQIYGNFERFPLNNAQSGPLPIII